MGDAVVEGGNPLGMSQTVPSNGIADDGGANPASGFSVVSAPELAAAVEMAKGLSDGAQREWQCRSCGMPEHVNIPGGSHGDPQV